MYKYKRDVDYYIPVLEKITEYRRDGKKISWKGRIINFPRFSVIGDSKENVETQIIEKIKKLKELKADFSK